MQSLKHCAHILEDVCDGDVSTIYRKVVQSEQPEPRALLVQALTRLSTHKKTTEMSYTKWLHELKSLFEAMNAVHFETSNELKIGFTFAHLGHDKRYEHTIERAIEKNLDLETSLTLLKRKATKIGDIKGSGPAAAAGEGRPCRHRGRDVFQAHGRSRRTPPRIHPGIRAGSGSRRLRLMASLCKP